MAERSATYRAEFRNEYEKRVASRRRRAVLVGGTLGVAAGVGWLSWLVSHTDF